MIRQRARLKIRQRDTLWLFEKHFDVTSRLNPASAVQNIQRSHSLILITNCVKHTTEKETHEFASRCWSSSLRGQIAGFSPTSVSENETLMCNIKGCKLRNKKKGRVGIVFLWKLLRKWANAAATHGYSSLSAASCFKCRLSWTKPFVYNNLHLMLEDSDTTNFPIIVRVPSNHSHML